jgi:hypothetical protein
MKGEATGMQIGREDGSNRRKPAPVTLCSSQNSAINNAGSNPGLHGEMPTMNA